MDLSISGMVVSEERIENNVSFLYPHWLEQYTFATLPPRVMKAHDINIFLRPFNMDVWLTLIISFILLFIIQNLQYESESGIELNQYVDRILEILFKFGNERPMFITSFHPDLCSM